MDDLYKALGDISSIRRQVANMTEFRGYGPATLAVTGVFAALAALAQALWVPTPASHIAAYLAVWVATAAVSAALTGVQMYTRSRRIHSALSDEMLRMAVTQFLPSVGAGLLVAVVIALYAPSVMWMLPGLWQVIFSLGIFSSCRFLPRPIVVVGAWYLCTGLASIAMAGNLALSPWTMGISYGVGQLLAAAILYFHSGESSDEA